MYADDRVFLIPNAANTTEVVRRLAEAAPADVTVTNEHLDYAVLAVQGPRSGEVLAKLGLPTDHAYMSFVVAPFAGAEVVVCRTGYTGEHGYELVVPAAGAGAVWDALFDRGRAVRRPRRPVSAPGTRCAPRWATRCTGRTCRWTISPLQARAGWAIGWKKPEFWGREALLAEKAAGPARTLWGLVATDRGIPRAHMTVLRGRRHGRRDHQRHVLADPADRHRAGAAGHVGRSGRGRRRSRSTYAAGARR